MTLRLWLLGIWDLVAWWTRCFWGFSHRPLVRGWSYHSAKQMVCLRCGFTRERRDDE